MRRRGRGRPCSIPTPAGTESAGIPHLGMSKQLAAAQSIPAVLRIRIEANADPDPAFKVNADTDPGRNPGVDDKKF